MAALRSSRLTSLVGVLLLFALMLVVPESPRYLFKQGREKEARRVLERVDGVQHAQREIAEIKMPDLNANDMEGAIRQIEGTARQMGIEVSG